MRRSVQAIRRGGVVGQRVPLGGFQEPFLIQEGFLNRTSRGRVATPNAYIHLGLKPGAPTAGQQNLFNG